MIRGISTLYLIFGELWESSIMINTLAILRLNLPIYGIKKYKNSIILTDDTRDVMGMGLLEQDYSVNSTNQKQIDQAYNRLLQLTPNIKAILGDEVMNYMTNNETPMAVVYSGQAEEMTTSNSHLHYVIPEKNKYLV